MTLSLNVRPKKGEAYTIVLIISHGAGPRILPAGGVEGTNCLQQSQLLVAQAEVSNLPVEEFSRIAADARIYKDIFFIRII